MNESRSSTEAFKKYASAYHAQYKTKDIHKAISLYEGVITDHPDTLEAGYSRSQVQNIVNTAVPKNKIMDSLLDLARIHFEGNAPLTAEPASA